MTVTTHVGSAPLEPKPNKWIELGKKQFARKPVRYAAVSAIAIVISQVTLAFGYGLLHWDGKLAFRAQLLAFVTSSFPSYYLNRMWVWGKGGKSHFWKEVFPFWGIGFVQLLISLLFIKWSQAKIEAHYSSHLIRTIGFLFSNLFVFGVMWVGKYIFFNKVLFKHHGEVASSAQGH
jgi:putative flippase GtrA